MEVLEIKNISEMKKIFTGWKKKHIIMQKFSKLEHSNRNYPK